MDDNLSALFTAYETALSNYEKSSEQINFMNEDGVNDFLLHFSTLSRIEAQINPTEKIILHTYYEKSDKDFMTYLKEEQTYALLFKINTSSNLDLAWLSAILENTKNILNQIDKEDDAKIF